MRLAVFLSVTVAAATTQAVANNTTQDAFLHWQGPNAGDVRGPCPFLNTFANHGFLPRSGKYITKEDLVDGLLNAVNFEPILSAFLFGVAAATNPQPNSTWFSLDHLSRHTALEHDASLSRVDAYLGHADVFNQEAFDETRSYWGDIVNVENGIDAIIARMKTCKATNPTYSVSDLGLRFIVGETAAFISVLGDPETITADKRLVEYLFQNERLPTELGWKRPDAPFTADMLTRNLDTVHAAYERRLNSTSLKKRSRRHS